KMITISKLIIYPIKSCAGIEVEEANLIKSGLQYDRLFTIIDNEDKIITARTHPKLVTIHPSFIKRDNKQYLKVITLENKDNELLIDLDDDHEPKEGEEVSLDLWESKDIQGYRLNEKANTWFSTYLNEPVSLVRKGSKPRPVIDFYLQKSGLLDVNSETSFADGFPLLIISEESVFELKDQLPKDSGINVDYRNFRPNILIKGVTSANKEDEFSLISIDNNIKIHCDIPCERCSLPNVNPDTGIKHSLEPSKTLSKYRRNFKDINKYKSFFGINAI
ncbi:hypothetical protein K502DRAFT_274697, partial [Neoconidiobolus thromboides FSU 785]